MLLVKIEVVIPNINSLEVWGIPIVQGGTVHGVGVTTVDIIGSVTPKATLHLLLMPMGLPVKSLEPIQIGEVRAIQIIGIVMDVFRTIVISFVDVNLVSQVLKMVNAKLVNR